MRCDIFSHDKDKSAALSDDPWFIYDHYLTVKNWTPNFQIERDTIEEVTVWIRIAGLLIEYYDFKILSIIGNMIGKTIKVDKNTTQVEGGKYVRICVEVNLTKPLLTTFTIKVRMFKIEYKCLHFLCLSHGRIDHYNEGCPEKKQMKDAMNDVGSAGVDQRNVNYDEGETSSRP